MIKQYFRIAFRNLAKQKGLATINILGLSIGIACFSLFLLYAVNEFNFDRFHKKADNIYRIYRWSEGLGGERADGDTYMPMPLGPALKKDFADVQDYCRIQDSWQDYFVKVNDQVMRMPLSFADPSFFNMFSFDLAKGNPSTVLKDQRSLVLTESIAKKLFGNEEPVGKTISIKVEEEFEPFFVTGVAKEQPANSTIRFDALANYSFLLNTQSGKRSDNNWNRSSYQTYVTIKSGSKLVGDKKRLDAFYKQYHPKEEEELRKAGYWKGKGQPVTYGFQPMAEIHTDTRFGGGSVDAIDPKTVWILIAIASGVLVIACINFTTLAIGRSAGRSKEVGIRKVVGGRKSELIAQFLLEAMLLAIVSTIIGLVLGKLLLPYFNNLSGRELSFSFSLYPEMIWLLGGLVLVVGFLAGSYPALVLSRFNPINVLKQKVKLGGSNFFTRSLVTFQFVLSVGLIISTLIIMQQLKYMRSKNPGFNKENVIVVDAEGIDTKKIYPLFKSQVEKYPEVIGVAGSELGIGAGQGWSRSGFDYKGKQKSVYEYYVDKDFIPLMSIQILKGRNFDPRIASDTTNSIIINEEMVKDFGWTLDNAVGQQIAGYNENLAPVVIGVVKNFNFRPFKEKVQPQMFHQFSDYAPRKYFVKVEKGDPSKSLARLQTTWKSVVPDLPFKYSFLDEDLNRFYKSEEKWSNIVGWAGGISIFLACLGLLGLAALTVINRTKEIGIRKVLGASVSGIVALISKDFLRLVLIAFVIATPLAWYLMNQWLQDFAYRINITAWIFIAAGISAIIIALVTVGLQALRAAIANPVNSLRTE